MTDILDFKVAMMKMLKQATLNILETNEKVEILSKKLENLSKEI